jgi:UDP-N-acetylglucosamine--N-acetylmuramyl-(pentapeptide) pyrophosphoryl-undecaprenol N-acetylglucosamine transferase
VSRGLVVLAAGGTGGHMFPAEALARELLARGGRVALVTDRRGHAFGEGLADVAVHRIRAGRFDTGLVGKVIGIAELALGTLEAGRKLRALEPGVVVGFGGYPSVPTMLAAARQGLPTLLHEQNAILGRANRLLASRVGTIATAFPRVGGMPAASRAEVVETGNPVRPAVAAMRGTPYAAPGADGPIHLLVLGGSQGARILSDIVPAAAGLLPGALRRRISIVQQARPEDLERVRHAYAETGVAAELASFFTDVPARLARAHLVVSRSGASTVAELAMVGRPAILVPYPHAADDHQTANAAAVAASGAAWLVPQTEFTAAALAERLTQLFASPASLAAAASAAQARGRPDAAKHLADRVMAAADGANSSRGHAA